MKVKCVKVGKIFRSDFTEGKIYDVDPITGYMEYESGKSDTGIKLARFIDFKLHDYSSDWLLIPNKKHIQIY